MEGDRVLLVDDEEDFLDALAKRLRARGLKVETSDCCDAALTKVEQHDFDVIVLDLAMPGADGIETLRRLKELDPDVQVILLTGHGTVPKGVEAMKLGAVDFVQKPADFPDLLEKIKVAGHRRVVLVEKRREESVSEILRERGW